MQVDILAVGVHPDDVELSSAGTLLRHIDMGYTVGLLDLTRGELGSRGSASIRTKEGNEAAIKLGAKFRENLDMPDGFMEYSKDNLISIIRVLRRSRPKIVLANSLGDRHPDHGRAAKLIADAAYYSGLLKIETQDDNGNKQEKHRPDHLYHYIQDRSRVPDFIVDIGGFLSKKMEVIRCFRSQFDDHLPGEYADQIKTPISGKDFLEHVEARARNFGREAGFEFGEGFEASRHLGVRNLFDLK